MNRTFKTVKFMLFTGNSYSEQVLVMVPAGFADVHISPFTVMNGKSPSIR